MSKFLFILTLILAAGGSFLAFQNRDKFVNLRVERLELDKQTRTKVIAKLDETVSEATKLGEEINVLKSEIDERTVKKEQENNNLKSKETELAKVDGDLKEKQGQIDKLETDLKELLKEGTIDQMTATIDNLTKENSDKRTTLDNATKELDQAKSKVADAQSSVKALNERSAARAKGIALNSRTGTILASNPDWNYAVANWGASDGLTSDAKLIVFRGSERIGLATVSALEKSRAVLDLVLDEEVAKDSIQPGDQILVEKVQR